MTEKITLRRPCQLFGRWWEIICYEDHELPDVEPYTNDDGQLIHGLISRKGWSTLELELKPMYGNDFGKAISRRVEIRTSALNGEFPRILWSTMMMVVMENVSSALEKTS